MTVVFFAKEPLWDKNGERTREHWIQIDRTKEGFEYSCGDEKGVSGTYISNDLDELIKICEREINYYDMTIEQDTTNEALPEPKEIVQFT